MRLRHLAVAVMLGLGGVVASSGASQAFLKDIIDYAIEARSAGDIAKDNDLVLKVNGIMADLGTIRASTEIYEQRLLITGVFDDKALYDKFEREVRALRGIKNLYWHVVYVPKDDPRNKTMLDWGTALAMNTKAGARLIGTAGVADVNYRTAVDSFGNLYLLGRARSKEEARKAAARARDGDGVKNLVNYVEVRP